MRLIAIISHALTLSLFAISGFIIVFSFKGVVEKVFQKKSFSPSPSSELEDGFVNIIEEMPRFPGCEEVSNKAERKSCAQQNMLKYIYEEIQFPEIARESSIEEMVVVRFYVNKEGGIEAPKILKDIGGGFGEEVLRVVRKMNDLPERWTPGKQNGKVVKVAYNLPVRIHLQ